MPRHQRLDRDRRQIVGADFCQRPPKRPIGVRTASQTNTSRIESLPESRVFALIGRIDREF
jgi:hypothetical protein